MSKVRILLIEDCADDAVKVQRSLAATPGTSVELHVTDHLEGGLEALAREPVDLVLLDLSLPDSVGMATLEAVQEAAPDVAVVVMSGLDDQEVAVRAVRMGAQDYLVKGSAGGEALRRIIRYALERKSAENQLRDYADTMVASVPLGLCVVRPTPPENSRDTAVVLAANPALAELAGLPLPQVLGRAFGEVLPGLVGTPVEESLLAVWRDEEPRAVQEVRVPEGVVPSGTFVARVFPLPRGAAGLALEDVTDARAAEEQRQRLERDLQHAQKMESLGILAGGIAHDFNNLLHVVLGNLELVLGDLSDDDERRAWMESADSAARRAAELTRQMLIYTGRGKRERHVLDLNVLVGEMSDLLRTVVPKKASLDFDFRPALPSVDGDPAQLRQVFVNLVANASDALGDGPGTIRVRTGAMRADRPTLRASYVDDDLPPGDYVFLEVSDTGCGMDGDTLSRLFDPFFTTKETGRGLGLAAVLGIVRAHHGAIRVSSRVGRGSTIRVMLPESRLPAAPARPRRVEPVARGRRRVLVADDEPAVRLLLATMLSHAGCTVEEARDGQEALERFREDPDGWDLVVLDLTMPRLGGVEALQLIRRERSNVPVLVVSGYGEEDVDASVAEASRVGYLQKPFRSKQLMRLLDELSRDG